VRLLVRKGERGLSGAILYGWRHTDAAILGVMDADLQHPPELLPALVAAILAGNDLAIGSRYTAGGQLGAWNPSGSSSPPSPCGPHGPSKEPGFAPKTQ
jgi:dolichol-phosphate mannosyltransferase